MPQKIYIFRHGVTIATKENKFYGWKILHARIFEAESRPFLERMAHYLQDIPTDYNTCSPLIRCVETAKIVSDITNKLFSIDWRLREYLIETTGMFRGRVQSLINDLNQSPHQTVMICTHGAVIAALKNLLITGQYVRNNIIDYPPPGILWIIDTSTKQLETIDFRNQIEIKYGT